jgi:MOSC domain-containing protein YiiM
MKQATVYSISISPERGQLKKEIPQAHFIDNYGIENDGHAGEWGRQVTCLSLQSVERANRDNNLSTGPGDFAENILIDGLDMTDVKVGSKIKLAENVVLEITQIGKEDHPSIVTRTIGVSLLPYEGLFCKVVSGGTVRKGDPAVLL